MPTPRKLPQKSDLTGEWVMFALGLLLVIVGAKWIASAVLSMQIIGFIALIWGVGAGVRAFAGFARAARRRK